MRISLLVLFCLWKVILASFILKTCNVLRLAFPNVKRVTEFLMFTFYRLKRLFLTQVLLMVSQDDNG